MKRTSAKISKPERSSSGLATSERTGRARYTFHGNVRATRYGREVRFRIERAAIDESAHFLALVAGQWDDALARLKEQVER